MKFIAIALILIIVVVPHVGTWIEISVIPYPLSLSFVVPHVGTWIEILDLWR